MGLPPLWAFCSQFGNCVDALVSAKLLCRESKREQIVLATLRQYNLLLVWYCTGLYTQRQLHFLQVCVFYFHVAKDYQSFCIAQNRRKYPKVQQLWRVCKAISHRYSDFRIHPERQLVLSTECIVYLKCALNISLRFDVGNRELLEVCEGGQQE